MDRDEEFGSKTDFGFVPPLFLSTMRQLPRAKKKARY
jgi:hypothetical protein